MIMIPSHSTHIGLNSSVCVISTYFSWGLEAGRRPSCDSSSEPDLVGRVVALPCVSPEVAKIAATYTAELSSENPIHYIELQTISSCNQKQDHGQVAFPHSELGCANDNSSNTHQQSQHGWAGCSIIHPWKSR